VEPLAASYGNVETTFAWGVFDDDADDLADTNIWQSASNLFANHTVFAWNATVRRVTEVASATIAGVQSQNNVFPIRFDLKFRKPHLLHVDHAIYLTMEFSDSLAAIANSGSLHGILRAIVEPSI